MARGPATRCSDAVELSRRSDVPRAGYRSQKGGIGKTTTAANLAVAWGDVGKRVLLIDLDPQFALTRRFGINPADLNATVVDVLRGAASVPGALRLGVSRGVDLLGARRDLANLELALVGEHHRERFLSEVLEDAGEYDVVVIDCPPSLGLLTVNAFVAADEVVVPVDMTDEGALQGAAEVRGIVARLGRHAPVRIRAVVRTKVDRRRVVYQQMNHGLVGLDLPVAAVEVPLTAEFQNAAAERVPLVRWRRDAVAAQAYRRLAAELA